MANFWPLQIIRRANEIGEDPLTLSNRFCQEYLDDMDALQCLLPTHQPRVSDHMEQIINMITQVLLFVSLMLIYRKKLQGKRGALLFDIEGIDLGVWVDKNWAEKRKL